MTEAGISGAEFGAALRGNLVLAGAGKMGGALLRGWLDRGLDPRRVTILDPHASDMGLEPFRSRGVSVNPAAGASGPADTLVLAIKPQIVGEAAPTLAGHTGRGTLLLSIVAGKTVADLATAFPGCDSIARAMPNTPAAVRRGMTGVFCAPGVTEDQKRELAALLGAVGAIEWLSTEGQIDAVTAVSGSGPAYVFFLTECLAVAAREVGLSPDAAARLARATVEGAAALMSAEPDTAPAVLRANVTSPGGTTAAALGVLTENDRLARLMTEAVKAARQRAKDLAGPGSPA